jgi:hypothetical protein
MGLLRGDPPPDRFAVHDIAGKSGTLVRPRALPLPPWGKQKVNPCGHSLFRIIYTPTDARKKDGFVSLARRCHTQPNQLIDDCTIAKIICELFDHLPSLSLKRKRRSGVIV